MKVQTFWNKAFLAALTRLPANEAKIEADLATELCIEHWQSHACDWAPNSRLRWKDQEIYSIPYSASKTNREANTD
jgi:hypothetical protein